MVFDQLPSGWDSGFEGGNQSHLYNASTSVQGVLSTSIHVCQYLCELLYAGLDATSEISRLDMMGEMARVGRQQCGDIRM